MSYTYTASDGTIQPLTNIISTYNIVSQDTPISVTNQYGGFPTVANNIINESIFDKSIGPIGYLDLGVDIGNEMPVGLYLYTPTRVRNDLIINRDSQNSANTVNLQFNNTSTTSVTFPNYINHISVVLCGGGGGGGGSSSSSNGGFSGTGGGGGGWMAVSRLILNESGRSFTIQAGEEGHCGVAADYAVGTSGLSAGDGANSVLKSTTNTDYYFYGQGGNAGAYATNGGGNGGGYGVSTNFPTNWFGPVNGGNGNAGGRGGSADNNRATCGGSAGYVNNNNAFNNSLLVSNKVANNNVNYLGGEGTSNNNANGPQNNCPGEPGGGDLSNVSNNLNKYPNNDNNSGEIWNNGDQIKYNNPSPDASTFLQSQRFGGGGGGASGNNGGNSGGNGGCGAPGFVLIFKYRA
jgi:hypothetical protein